MKDVPMIRDEPYDPEFERVQREKREAEAELVDRQKELRDVEEEVKRHEEIDGTTGPKAERKYNRNKRLMWFVTSVLGGGGALMIYLTLKDVLSRQIFAILGAAIFGVGGFLGTECFLFYVEKHLSPRAFLRVLNSFLAVSLAAFLFGVGILHHTRTLQVELDRLVAEVEDSLDGGTEGIEERIEALRRQIWRETGIGNLSASLGTEVMTGTFLFRSMTILGAYEALAGLMKRRRWLMDRIIKLKRIVAGKGGMSRGFFSWMRNAKEHLKNNYGRQNY